MNKIKLFISLTLVFTLISCASKQKYTKTVAIPQAQLESIRSAVAQSLPPEAKVSVTAQPGRGRYSKPNIVIYAHLLEGYYADDTSPYVRGGLHHSRET